MNTQSARCAMTVATVPTDTVEAASRHNGVKLAVVLAALIVPVGYGRAEAPPIPMKTNTCVACHRTPKTGPAFQARAQDQFLHWYGAVHGQKAVTCDKCHGGNSKQPDKDDAHRGVLSSADPKSPVYFKNLPETCGKCHKAVLRQFATSKHYEDLKDDRLAPSCTTCHGFEMDVGAINPLQLAGRCSLCHNDTDPGIKPEVAGAARRALEHVLEAGRALDEAATAVDLIGHDSPTTAGIMGSIEEGKRQLRLAARHWHAFDLGAFEKELAAVRAIARKARMEALAEIGAAKP